MKSNALGYTFALRIPCRSRVGESLPTDIRARDDSSPVSSTTDPSRRDVLAEGPSPAMEGVSGVDIDLSATTMTLEDPLAVSPSI